MKDSVFRAVLIGIIVAGVIATAVLIAVTVHLYRNISIISFIGNGR